MGFQSNIPQGMTLVGFTTPVESDSKSVTSTISTKNQFKPSKIDQLRLINNNDGYHLLSSSNTQPRITSVISAPPHPPGYPHVVIPRDQPDQYHCEGHTHPAIKTEDNNTVDKPAKIPHDNKNNNDISEADDDSVWSFDEMDEDKTAPAQAVANTTRTRTSGDDSNDNDFVPIPFDKPNFPVSVSSQINPTKPTTTPTPTQVSNTYACLGNNNKEEEDDDDDDDDDDSTDMPPVLVEICTLRNNTPDNMPTFKPQQIFNGPDGDDDDDDNDDVNKAPLDVGTINNNNMLEIAWGDDASQVTVATKNFRDNTRPKTKRTHKNNHKNKKKEKQKPKKQYGKQVAGSTKGNENTNMNHEDDHTATGSNLGTNGKTNNMNSND